MNLQVLVSAVNAEPPRLITQMKLATDAIIINQCEENAYEELHLNQHRIRCYSFQERGVGLSRNNALLRADHEISLFSDEDIVYHDGYETLVLDEFTKHPEADMIVFNFAVEPERRTYYNEHWHQVHWYNCGRYPTFSFAVRTAQVHAKNITYSLLFGGGAKYSNGEDSLFIRECLHCGLHVYASPVELGREEPRPSTWFQGYTEKFFIDRGVLYWYLYGRWAGLLAMRFLYTHRDMTNGAIKLPQAMRLMRRGIQEARDL
ncbi:MAG: glycosyltransferase [Lachnospiraceae bacterium]